MAENKTIQGKDLDMPCKHKKHTSLKHIGLKLACQDSSCKRPFSRIWSETLKARFQVILRNADIISLFQ